MNFSTIFDDLYFIVLCNTGEASAGALRTTCATPKTLWNYPNQRQHVGLRTLNVQVTYAHPSMTNL